MGDCHLRSATSAFHQNAKSTPSLSPSPTPDDFWISVHLWIHRSMKRMTWTSETQMSLFLTNCSSFPCSFVGGNGLYMHLITSLEGGSKGELIFQSVLSGVALTHIHILKYFFPMLIYTLIKLTSASPNTALSKESSLILFAWNVFISDQI